MFEFSDEDLIEPLPNRGSLGRYLLALLLGVTALLYAQPGLAPVSPSQGAVNPLVRLEEVALKPVAPLAPIVQAIASDIARRFHLASAQALRITRAAFQSASEHRSVHPTLVLAVAAVESRYQSDAVNPSGARGLMQVMPEAHPELRTGNDDSSLLEIEPNIKAGTAILAKYSRHGRASLYETLSRYLGSARASGYVKQIQEQIRHLSAVAERATPAGYLNPLATSLALTDSVAADSVRTASARSSPAIRADSARILEN